MTIEVDNLREQQIGGLNGQLMTGSHRGRGQTCPPRTGASGDRHQRRYPEHPGADRFSYTHRAPSKTDGIELARAELQNKMGERNVQVIAIRAQLATVSQQIDAEAEHILGNMKNAYDIAVQREQSLEANLQSLTANINSEAYMKLQQLRRVADAERKVYESYLSQYNDISERRELQDASARIISPATLPRSPSSPRRSSSMRLPGWPASPAVYCFAFLLEYSTRRQDWCGDRAILWPTSRREYSFSVAPENPGLR